MKTLSIFLVSLAVSATVFSQTSKFNNTKGIAIGGYDVVAYFSQKKATEGSSKYTFDWDGSKWQFSSPANLDSFKLSPEKYAPQFGGYCAYGCSESHLAPTDPEAFTILDNKLYLNYNKKVKEMWIKDTNNRIRLATEYWSTLNK
jgi:YHS domain-containing protein